MSIINYVNIDWSYNYFDLNLIDAIFLQAERTYNHGIILRVDEVNGLFIFYIVKKMCFFFYENLGINGDYLLLNVTGTLSLRSAMLQTL